MPWGLERWHGGHDLQFSCYRRQALLPNAHRCELLKALEDVRRRYAHQESGLIRVNEWSVLKLKFVQPTAFPQ